MKTNELHSPVDDFFRQHETDIPVVYDPDHWNRLAAALDAAGYRDPAHPPVATPTPSKPTRFRGGKGWWVSGIWILALVTSAWIFHRASGYERWNNADAPALTAPDAEPKSGSSAQPGNDRSGIYPDSKNGTPVAPAQPGVSRQTLQEPVLESSSLQPDTLPVFGQAPTDSSRLNRPLPALSDTFAPKATPAKKKKHLFW